MNGFCYIVKCNNGPEAIEHSCGVGNNWRLGGFVDE